jgi:hypothetical protein
MPGAPLNAPPLILLSGDCTGSAYIFAPSDILPAANTINNAHDATGGVTDPAAANTSADGATSGAIESTPNPRSSSSVPPYEMVFEIQCGATVGSAAVAAALDGSVGNHITHTNSPFLFTTLLMNNIHSYCLILFRSLTRSLTHFSQGDVDIFIPSYELNKIHKFQLAYKKKSRDKHGDRDASKMQGQPSVEAENKQT